MAHLSVVFSLAFGSPLRAWNLAGPLDLNWGIYGPGGTLPSNKCRGRFSVSLTAVALKIAMLGYGGFNYSKNLVIFSGTRTQWSLYLAKFSSLQ